MKTGDIEDRVVIEVVPSTRVAFDGMKRFVESGDPRAAARLAGTPGGEAKPSISV